MTRTNISTTGLLGEIQSLIDSARERALVAVNQQLSLLYWQVGQRIHAEVLQGQRAEYGKQIVTTLAAQLTESYGKGWSAQQLRHCLRVAETFPAEAIFSTLRRELSWSHIKTLVYLDDPLARDFYAEMARLEHWSSRQLQERIQSMLFERTAISRKPEETTQRNIAALRERGGRVAGYLTLPSATELIAAHAYFAGARGRFGLNFLWQRLMARVFGVLV